MADEEGQRPMPTRRHLLIGSAAAGGAALAVACGGGAPAAPAAALDTPASIVWLNWEGAGVSLDGNTRSVTSFQTRYPKIKVENAGQAAAGDTYWGKFSSLQAAGQPADLWEWEPKNVVDYVQNKLARDLTPYVARDKFDTSDFFAKGIDQYRLKNGLFGLPRDFPNRELTYNVTAFQKEGIPLPKSDWKSNDWTWDVFLDAARRLQKADGSQLGFNTGTSLRNWAVWVWANGGEVIDEQKLECTLDRPPAVEALQFLQDLINKHRVWSMPLPGGLSFDAGTVAINENAPAGMGNVRKNVADKFQWDVVMHPRGKNGKYVAAGGGAGWAAHAQSKFPDATWALLKHVTSSEEQIELCQVGGTIGSRKSVTTNPCFFQKPPEHVQLFVDGADYLHVDPRVAGWNDVEKILGDELKSLWTGQKPAQQVAADIKRLVDPVLKSAAK
jgi:multiple sugar transport system substrate-binding protein